MNCNDCCNPIERCTCSFFEPTRRAAELDAQPADGGQRDVLVKRITEYVRSHPWGGSVSDELKELVYQLQSLPIDQQPTAAKVPSGDAIQDALRFLGELELVGNTKAATVAASLRRLAAGLAVVDEDAVMRAHLAYIAEFERSGSFLESTRAALTAALGGREGSDG